MHEWFATCVSMHHAYAWGLWRSEEGVGSSVPGVADGCEVHVGAGN